LIVTDSFDVPPELEAVHVNMVEFVSLMTADVSHPEAPDTADCPSATCHETCTLLVYQPLLPRAPLTTGVISGGDTSLRSSTSPDSPGSISVGTPATVKMIDCGLSGVF
jgi:hypothetical protein